MGKIEKIEALIDGGKATAAPPLGPALGPLGVNIGQVIAEINKKTESFKGMKVPVTVIVDSKSKEFEIEVGTPPTSQLIKKELGLDKGSGLPNIDKTANMSIEQAIKVAKMKIESMFVKNLKSAVKTVIGSANSLGFLIEGKTGPEINKDIDAGKYDKEITEEITETSDEKKQSLKEDLEKIKKGFAKDLEKRKLAAQEAEELKAKKTAAPTTEEKTAAKPAKKTPKKE